MGQSVRQQTGSSIHHRPGASKRLQTHSSGEKLRSSESLSASTQVPVSSQAARSPHSAQQKSPQPKSRLRRKRSHRPLFLFVFLLWAVSLVTAVLATRLLLDPTLASSTTAGPSSVEDVPAAVPSVEPTPEPKPIAEAPEQSPLPSAVLDDSYFYPPAEADNLPIVVLGSTALSCAMGCILVARALHPRRSPPQLQGRSKKLTESRSVAKQTSPAAAPVAQSVQMPPTLALPAAIQKPVRTALPAETATPAIATALPAEQSLPLDWEEPSLADSLDLRQRYSLPS